MENESVRVLMVTIKPSEKEPIHTYKWPSVMIVISSARIRYFNEDGEATEYPKRDISPSQTYCLCQNTGLKYPY